MVVQSSLELIGTGLILMLALSAIGTVLALVLVTRARERDREEHRRAALWCAAVAVATFAVSSNMTFVWLPATADMVNNGITECTSNTTGSPALMSLMFAKSAANNSHCITTKEDRALHNQLAFVADMHCDALLWPKRDLLKRNWRGHVDVPRLAAGNVALQVLALVTGVPKRMNFAANPAPTLWKDSLTLKNVIERQPWSAVTTRIGRAVVPARRLQALVTSSRESLVFVRTSADLRSLVDRRVQAKRANVSTLPVGVLLAVEGAHALDGDIANVDVLYDLGLRMFGLSHFFDTPFGGSSAGVERGGLTEAGRKLLSRLDELRIVVDLAHASTDLIDDVLGRATSARPPIVSHAGMHGLCPSPRNLQDHHALRIAELGGLIGIAFFRPAVCAVDGYPYGDPVQEIVAQIDYAVQLVGIEHVALGSDWDGAVSTPFDAARLSLLTGALVDRGYTMDQLERIMGGNVLQFLLTQLPE